jgi:hypothetical protein
LALTAGTLPAQIHRRKLKKFGIVPKMPKAHVAPLAKRPTHAPCAVVVINHQIIKITAYNTRGYVSSYPDHVFLVWADAAEPPIQLSVRPPAWTAPAIKARFGLFMRRKVFRV